MLAQAHPAHLAVVRQQDPATRTGQHLLLDGGLRGVRRGDPPLDRDRVGAEERDVDVEAGEGPHRQVVDLGQGRRLDAAAQGRHGELRVVHQHQGDRERVGVDGQPTADREELREPARGRPCVQQHGAVRRQVLQRRSRDPGLLPAKADACRHGGRVGELAHGDRTAVDPAEESLGLQHDEVLADRLVRDAELGRDGRRVHAAVGMQPGDDGLAPLVGVGAAAVRLDGSVLAAHALAPAACSSARTAGRSSTPP